MTANVMVTATWDAEVNVWTATSDDVPGLVCEETTFPMLDATVRHFVPELFLLNMGRADPVKIVYRIQ